MAAKLAVVFVGGLVVLLQTLIEEKVKTGWNFFWILAALVSLVSTLVCIPALVMEVLGKEGRGAPCLVLAGIWTAGLLPMTMERPFNVTGNGYFGTWAAAIASWMMVKSEYAFLREPFDRVVQEYGGMSLAVLLLASLIAFVQTAWSCSTVNGWCNGNASWVIVCSALSAVLCGVLVAHPVAAKLKPYLKCISLFFLVWWAAGAVITTFEEPYETTYANGYFSCWMAVAAAALLVESSWGTAVADTALQRASEVTGGSPPEVIVLFLASLVTLMAAAIDCGDVSCGGLVVWAILCSCTSVLVSFLLIFDTIRGGWTATSYTDRIAAALCAWWLIGTVCMTFKGPFHRLGNGYFATWAAFIAACIFAVKNVEVLSRVFGDLEYDNAKEIASILLASAVLFSQAVYDASSAPPDTGSRIWSIICSLISLVVCIALMKASKQLEGVFKWIVTGWFCWWTLGVTILTFHSPYVRTGNAYFAAWCAWGACGKLFLQQFPQLKGYHDFGKDEPNETVSTRSDEPSSFTASAAPSSTIFGAQAASADLDMESAPPVVIDDDEEPLPVVGSGIEMPPSMDNDI